MTTMTGIHVTKETPLFTIQLKVHRLPHRGRHWADVPLYLLREDPSPHTYHWPDLLDLNTLTVRSLMTLQPDSEGQLPDMSMMEAIGRTYEADRIRDQYFTADERDAILAWFERHPYNGTTIAVHQLALPVLANYAPVDICGYGGAADGYPFSQEDGFDCPIPFNSYYDVSGCPPYKDDGTLDEKYWTEVGTKTDEHYEYGCPEIP